FAARRMSCGKNSLVPICTKFISTTNSNSTITTAPVRQRCIYKRLSGWLSLGPFRLRTRARFLRSTGLETLDFDGFSQDAHEAKVPAAVFIHRSPTARSERTEERAGGNGSVHETDRWLCRSPRCCRWHDPMPDVQSSDSHADTAQIPELGS